jgi:hypothetical protein
MLSASDSVGGVTMRQVTLEESSSGMALAEESKLQLDTDWQCSLVRDVNRIAETRTGGVWATPNVRKWFTMFAYVEVGAVGESD